MKKFHILIYWCQMNYSDSARIKSVLQNMWFFYVDSIKDADIVIFDTCSVRQKSEDKITGKLKVIPKDKKIWITWCMIQHNLKITNNEKFKKWNFFQLWNDNSFVSTNSDYQNTINIIWLEKIDDIFKKTVPVNSLLINYAFNPIFGILKKSFPNLELFFRIDDLWFLPDILRQFGYEFKDPDIELKDEYTSIIPGSDSNMIFREWTKTAYVPIQTWCSQFCAYCIVPYARGLEKNRPIEDVISEIQFHVNQGAEEIVLLGQIVNKHKNFKEILKKTLKIKWIKWLRYTSPYPTYYDDEIFAMHESEQILCPQIHIPMQSWSDNILKKMFRWYSADQYKEFIDKIRWLKREMSIHTDIIVWFTDETDDDFQKTVDMVKYAMFDMIYIGIYSPRPWTYWANNYKDNVLKSVKMQRWWVLNDLLHDISLWKNRKLEWKEVEFMVTEIGEQIFGYDESMRNIFMTWKHDLIRLWDFARWKINKWWALKLYGEILDEINN